MVQNDFRVKRNYVSGMEKPLIEQPLSIEIDRQALFFFRRRIDGDKVTKVTFRITECHLYAEVPDFVVRESQKGPFLQAVEWSQECPVPF